MKRLFTLITSIVLATSLLAVPCFAAEPEDLPTPQTGVTETEQPEDPDESKNTIARIAEAGEDISMVVEFFIKRRAENINIWMGLA